MVLRDCVPHLPRAAMIVFWPDLIVLQAFYEILLHV